MNDLSTLLQPEGNSVCQHCGVIIESVDPLGGGVCEACLWKDLTARPSRGASVYLDLVEGHDILEELGRGGMGVVYRAREHNPGRDVALKMLLPLESGDAELRGRFQQEARALAELDHPAILPLYHVGEADGLPYFTMKLARSGTLAQRLKLDGHWLPRPSAELVILLAGAIHYAHERGVIHRDIKPGNILFDEEGRPYVADFGLAKLQDGGPSFTRSAGIMGTLAYLAPEIPASGARAATTSSDVYALGAVLYELLSGRPPFVVEGMAALLRKISEDQPDAPSTLNSQVPRDLEIICLKCLSKSPRDRYASASAVADDLRRWLKGEPILARRITGLQRLGKWARRRPALASLSAALILLTFSSGLWLASSNHQLNLALSQARASQAKADQRAEFLLGSFADSLEDVGRLGLLNAAFEDVLKTDTGTDDPSRVRRTKLLTRWGEVLRLQGRTTEAQTALRRAAREAATLPASSPSLVLQTLAESGLALAIADTDPVAEPLKILGSLQSRLDKNEFGIPPSELLEPRAITASALAKLGLETAPEAPGVRECTAKASDLWRQWHTISADDPRRTLALARALEDESTCCVITAKKLSRDGKPAASYWTAALHLDQEAFTLVDRMHPPGPVNASIERQRACLLRAIGSDRLTQDPAAWREALPQLKSACERLDLLVRGDSLDWRSQLEAAAAHYHLARAAKAGGDENEYDAQQRVQESILSELHRQSPDVKQWALARIQNSIEIARWHLDRGRQADAERHFENAWAAAGATLLRHLEQSSDQEGFASAAETVAEAWYARGQPAKAEASFRRALNFLQDQQAAGTAGDWCRWTEARLQRHFADLLQVQKKTGEALERNLQSLKIRAGLLRAGAAAAKRDPRAVPHGYLASERTLITLQRIKEAVDLAREAMDLRRECALYAGAPEPWAEPVIAAVEAGITSGGPLEFESRSLAAQAMADLFPGAASGDNKSGLPGPGGIPLREKLRKLAGNALPLSSASSQ